MNKNMVEVLKQEKFECFKCLFQSAVFIEMFQINYLQLFHAD